MGRYHWNYDHPLKDAIKKRYRDYTSFSNQCGVSRYSLQDIIAGRSGSTPQAMQRMADVLGVSYDTMRIWCRGGKWQERPRKDHPLAKAIVMNLYTYEEFAEACGLNVETVMGIIAGRSRGSEKTIEAIANALDVPADLVRAWCRGESTEMPDFHIEANEEVEMPKPQFEYSYVLESMKIYGNTSISNGDKLNDVLAYLKANGLDCKTRHINYGKNDDLWIIERIMN